MGLFSVFKKKELAEIEQLKEQLEKFKPISDINAELLVRQKQLDELISSKNLELKTLQQNFQTLNVEYQNALSVYTKLRKEVSLFESKIDIIEYGIYRPVYDFEKSDDYRLAQNKIIELQKHMILSDAAAVCHTAWTVANSEAKGKAVVSRYKKLMLRAFNGECDVLVSKVKWNNIGQLKERMQKLFEAINKSGSGFNVYITGEFRDLKRQELVLEHEYQLKKQQEKEAMRAVQEEIREEEKARREFEQAQKEAEREEANFQRALVKAQKEMGFAAGENYEKLKAQIEVLEQELKEAQEKKERALSMAQQTKRGYVYIISNIGSFGENVYKIGMTRRLEPEDRIRELGDASVPFQFDVHAMIYSDEARTLEYELHKAFTNKKVNMLNYRKEFFKVTLDEIEAQVKTIGLNAAFSRLPEAMEYRETLAILNKMNTAEPIKSIEELIADEFPSTLAIDR